MWPFFFFFLNNCSSSTAIAFLLVGNTLVKALRGSPVLYNFLMYILLLNTMSLWNSMAVPSKRSALQKRVDLCFAPAINKDSNTLNKDRFYSLITLQISYPAQEPGIVHK